MSETTLACDQAIFTSIRTPTGDGYRIVAASKGLRPEEKQSITRSSPSHDALCRSAVETPDKPTNILGTAFYPLPSGRLCVALSCNAGAEHTGRGGQRVYTHNLVFDKSDFPTCCYNPFVVLRAMVEAGLLAPQLKPPSLLPELQLPITESAGRTAAVPLTSTLGPGWRGCVLDALLAERTVIVNIDDDWLGVAEALLMGVPGPMRAEVSFSTGLRFSVGRCHRLSLSRDDPNATKSRITGRAVEYVDPTAGNEPEAPSSAWLSFVEGHWSSDDLAGLSRRTSRPFADVSPIGRDRLGCLYKEIDTAHQTDTAKLLSVVAGHFDEPELDVEADVAAELAVNAQCVLVGRFIGMSWQEATQHWQTICTIWQQSEEGRLFAQPLVEQVLRAATNEHRIVAAEAALTLATPQAHPGREGRAAPQAAMHTVYPDVVERILTRVADWADSATSEELEEPPHNASRLDDLVSRWSAVRPECPVLERIRKRCRALTVP
ncbi:MAG: hypothetical protein JSU86_20780 [Phycisphaerales bacterium]|nr:MAG: hypothetical protein JSU86_20780 [Phycisphaerales bacterium]